MNSTESKGLDDDQRWSLIDSRAKEERLVRLFRHLRDHSISPVAIKGWSISRFYPANVFRSYTDIDVAVDPADYDRVIEIVKAANLKSPIDLHSGLRTLDTNEWSELFKRSYEIELHGTPVRVLADEDNLRIISTHWLMDGGVYRAKLWDIYYLVTNRRRDFDWNLCLDTNSARRSWIFAAIAAARDYLDLDTADLPPEINEFQLPDWFRKTVEHEWKLGPFFRIPLGLCLTDPDLLSQQIRRRFPPNKIAATVDVEGTIDESGRFLHQLQSLKKRAFAFLVKP